MTKPQLCVSIDIETLGLKPYAPVIQIGACVFDVNSDKDFGETEFLVNHDSYDHAEPFAASMHPELLRILGHPSVERSEKPFMDYYDAVYDRTVRIVTNEFVTEYFTDWLDFVHDRVCDEDFTLYDEKGKIRVTGKNFSGFDQPHLLQSIFDWEYIKIAHRIIDPGNLWWIPEIDGPSLPSTEKCCDRANVAYSDKHTALGDACMVRDMVQAYTKMRQQCK